VVRRRPEPRSFKGSKSTTANCGRSDQLQRGRPRKHAVLLTRSRFSDPEASPAQSSSSRQAIGKASRQLPVTREGIKRSVREAEALYRLNRGRGLISGAVLGRACGDLLAPSRWPSRKRASRDFS
jgi:hypothetical protein